MDHIDRILLRRARRTKRDREARIDERLALQELDPADEVIAYRDPENMTWALWDPRARTLEVGYGS